MSFIKDCDNWLRLGKMLTGWLLFVSIFFMTSIYALDLTHGDLLVGKLQYERELERRIQSILISTVGPQKAKVSVTLEVNSEVVSSKEETIHSETTSQTIVLSNGIQEENFDNPEAGTGGPGKEGSANQASSNVLEETRTTKETLSMPSNLIKKLSISLLISDKVPDALIEKAKTIIMEAVSFNADRGDQLSLQKVTFISGAAGEMEQIQDQKQTADFWLALTRYALSLILGVAFLLFLFSLLNTFRTLKQAEINVSAQAIAAKAAPAEGEVAGPAGATAIPAAGFAAVGVPGTMLPGMPMGMPGTITVGPQRFAFLQEKNSRALLHLIQKEPIQTIALVLSYITPEQAAGILQSLPGEIQSQVASRISTISEMSPTEVNRIEQDIKEKIDYVVGGRDSLVNIIQSMGPDGMKAIIGNLDRSNPKLAGELRPSLFTFDDVLLLDSFAIQQVVRQLSIPELAIALKNASEEIKNKVFGALAEGAAQLLRQELELMRPLPARRYIEAQRKFIQAVRILEQQGVIFVQREESTPSSVGGNDLGGGPGLGPDSPLAPMT